MSDQTTTQPEIIGTLEAADAVGRAVVRTPRGLLHIQLRQGVRKQPGESVSEAEVQPQP